MTTRDFTGYRGDCSWRVAKCLGRVSNRRTLTTRNTPKALFFFFQAEDGIRDLTVTGVQTCALPISVHVSEATRRSTSMAPEVLERLARIQKAHDALPRPPQVGRTIGLASPPTTR